MRDIQSNLKATLALAPAVSNTATGTQIDTLGYDSLAFTLAVGAYTDGTHTFKLQETDVSNTDWTDVAAADLEGSFAVIATDQSPSGSSRANSTQIVGYKGNKRYVRIVSTVVGGSTGIARSAVAIQGHAHQRPVN